MPQHNVALFPKADPLELEKMVVTAKLPGEPGVWIFITGDVCMFLLYFLVFTSGRLADPVQFEQGRLQLNATFGFVNTLLLLTSSWFVVQGVEAARRRRPDPVKRNLAYAIALGCAFAVLKIVGYAEDILAGHTITTNQFFGYYFAITGVHLLHVLVGTAVLLICFFKVRRGPIDDKFLVWIESGGCFWHMVDMLWVILFPMFYLLRAL